MGYARENKRTATPSSQTGAFSSCAAFCTKHNITLSGTTVVVPVFVYSVLFRLLIALNIPAIFHSLRLQALIFLQRVKQMSEPAVKPV